MRAGRIEIIVGPMFAGKTTEMLRRIDRAELARRRCLVIKHARDCRYSDDKVSTHDYIMHDAFACSELMPNFHLTFQYDVIGVDEGQFFPDIVQFAEKLANIGKTVIVAALDGTFQRKPFGRVLELISKCESITKITAVCRETGNDAPFTMRTISSNDIELIGGAEMYSAVSRSSFFGVKTLGAIHLTMGPVKSGKTTDLLRILNRHKIAGKKVLLIRPASINDHHNPKLTQMKTDILPSIEYLSDFDIIGIDEAQKYEGLVEWADTLANINKLVVVSALDGDEKLEAFPEIIELFPKCEKIEKLDSVCQVTGLPAPFTAVIEGMNAVPVSRLGILLTRMQLSIPQI